MYCLQITTDCHSKKSLQEENLREKPGYAHLSEPLHVLIEAEQPANMIDAQSSYALEMIEDLLKPVVRSSTCRSRDKLTFPYTNIIFLICL